MLHVYPSILTAIKVYTTLKSCICWWIIRVNKKSFFTLYKLAVYSCYNNNLHLLGINMCKKDKIVSVSFINMYIFCTYDQCMPWKSKFWSLVLVLCIQLYGIMYAHQTVITKWARRPHHITDHHIYCLTSYRFFLLWLLHYRQWQIMDRRFM